MIRITTYLILTFLLGSGLATGQLVHFSDYSHAPISLSPALAGAYHGSIRVGVTVREQYREFIQEPYKTTSLFIDSPLALGLPENQWIGIGANVSKSEAGALAQQQISTRLGISYHRALDRKFSTVVGIGMQYNLHSRDINNPSVARFEDQLNGQLNTSPDQILLDNFEASFSGFNAGAYLKKRFNKKVQFDGGIGIDNLTKTSFITDQTNYLNKIPLRYNVYGNWQIRKSKKVILAPTLILQRYGPVTNVMAILGLRQKFNEKKDIILTYRIGYRYRDAGFAGAGAMFNSFSLALNYDMTLSSAKNHNGMTGALELGFYKIFTIRPRVKHKVIEICPRL